MKVAIITINDNNNYGNRLQNYALQTFLKHYIDIVETLWYDELTNFELKNIINLKSIIKFLINKNGYRDYLKKQYLKECIKIYNIKKFSQKYIDIKFINDLSKIPAQYDYFIVGSDQIWNPNFWLEKNNHANIRFLKFTSKEKRIAYAASIAIPEIPKDKKQFFKDSLNEMKAISMREKAGADLVKVLIGREVPVVVDPTILLSKEEWQKIEMRPEWYNDEKYILTYFLGNDSSIVQNIAKKNNWKIYNLMDSNDLELYTSRVEEFIFLIEHAQLVVTDSFHACVFSILLNTPFLVINRKQKGVADMTSRINTLLELFGYQNRYIINGKSDLSDEEIIDMNFDNVKFIQEQEKIRSLKYIKNALNLK